jgi:hypothetical protein
LDLLAATALHLLVFFTIGAKLYLTYVAAPLLLVLPVVSTMRSICEHHNTYGGTGSLPKDHLWRETRTIKTSPLIEFLWSNVNYHLEHHLFPTVPFHNLPRLRAILASEFVKRDSILDNGYFVTSLRLLTNKNHIRSDKLPAHLVNTSTIAFKAKVAWFKDILKNGEARQYLWSLYYAGEAYVELHPNGVFIPLLKPPLDRLLDRHLSDETRHAALFCAFLMKEGRQLLHVNHSDDLGWFLLNSMVPDIVAQAKSNIPFTNEQTARYMAFLHTLELRSVSDLYALLIAARQLKDADVVSALESILPDEVFHAAYTHKAAIECLDDKQAALRLLDSMRNMELKLYTKAIRRMVGEFMRRRAMPYSVPGLVRWLGTIVLCQIGSPFPKLPVYETVPHKIADGEDLRRFVPPHLRRTSKLVDTPAAPSSGRSA